MAEWWKELFPQLMKRSLKRKAPDTSVSDPAVPDMPCRVCGQDFIADCELLFDKEQNCKTDLGLRLSLLIGETEEDTSQMSICICFECSAKVKLCFALFVEVRTSYLIQQYVNTNKNGKKPQDQIFNCGTCDENITGMMNFIKHFEVHAIEAGSVDLIEFSLVDIMEEPTEEIKDLVEYLEYDDKAAYTASGSSGEDNANDDLVLGFKMRLDVKHDDLDKLMHKYLSPEEEFQVRQLFTREEVGNLDSSSDESYDNLFEEVQRVLEESSSEDELTSLFEYKVRNGKYYCDICDTETDYKCLAKVHYFEHITGKIRGPKNKAQVKGRSCNYCCEPLSSENKTHVQECRKQFHALHSFLCDFCGKSLKVTNWKKHLKAHKKVKEPPEGWLCTICNTKCTSNRTLKYHMEKHQTLTRERCNICFVEVLPRSMRKHRLTHQAKTNICHICGKAFTFHYILQQHLALHGLGDRAKGEARPKKCRLCQCVFNTLDDLRTHLEEAHGVKPKSPSKTFECEHCQGSFLSKTGLKMHLMEIHNQSLKEFYCEACEREFNDMITLRAHLQLMHDMKPADLSQLKSKPVYRRMACNICEHVARSENNLRTHMRKVHNLKNSEMECLKPVCERCDKTFSSKQSLANHVNSVHLNLRMLQCQICKQSFSKYGSLIVHMYTHTGEKNFVCEVCDRTFRQRNDAIRHLWRHVRDGDAQLENAAIRNISNSRHVQKKRIFLKESWLVSNKKKVPKRRNVSRYVRQDEHGKLSSIIIKAEEEEDNEYDDEEEDEEGGTYEVPVSEEELEEGEGQMQEEMGDEVEYENVEYLQV